MIPAFVINLSDEPDRFVSVASQLECCSFISPIRVVGLPGALLSDVATTVLTKNEWAKNYKGALGCFLSHTRAWELLVASGSEYALILEDDIVLQNLHLLKELQLPMDCDVAFCNDQTCYPRREVGHGIGGADAMFHTFAPALEFVARSGHSIGCYGYLLSRRGAIRLLEFVRTDTLFSHVDLRIAAYCIERSECPRIEAFDSEITKGVAALRRTYSENHRLNGYVFSTVICSHPVFISRRDREDKSGLTTYPVANLPT